MAEEIVVAPERKYSEDKMLNAFMTASKGPASENLPAEIPGTELILENNGVKVETPTTVVEVKTDEPVDYNKIISEKTAGKFNTLDDVLAAASKEPTYKVPEFANEDSKKVYDLLLEGKVSEVADILSSQNRDYSKYNDLDVRKEIIRKENPYWSEEDVAEFVSDRYGIGELVSEEDRTELTASQLKEKEARIARNERELKRDAKADREKLSASRVDIKLPDIAPKQAPVEDQAAKENKEFINAWITQLDEGAKASPAAIDYKYTIEIPDGEDKGSYSTDFKIDGENKKALDNYVRNFLPPVGSELAYVKDGKVDVALVVSEGIDKLFGRQMNKVLLKEAIANTKKAIISGIKNTTDGPTDLSITPKVLTREEWLIKQIKS